MKHKGIVQLLALLATSVATSLAFADTNKSIFTPEKKAEGMAETKPSLAFSAGMSDTAENRRTSVNYNLEYDEQPWIPFSVGVRLGSYSTPTTPNQAALTRTSLLATGNYNFGGDIPVIKNSYVGLQAGPVLDNTNGSATVDLGIAPRIGFDIPLGGDLAKYSLGAVADYMWVGGAKPSVFGLNGVIKYWF